MKTNITGILLCGGKSSRMGVDKYSLQYDSLPMYKPSLDMLQWFCSEVIVSSNVHFPEFKNYRIVADEVPNIGPIGGLYSCLKVSQTSLNMVVACDMPLVSGQLMARLLSQPDTYDAYVPVVNGYPEPLYAIYATSVAPVVASQIAKGQYSLKKLLSVLNVCYLDGGNETGELKNVNTPDQLM